jgi:uncharacterized protein YaiL (DUF2058 family)
MKYLIQRSKKIYFKILAIDKKINKKYGDICLLFENKIICLNKILIDNFLAIPLCNGKFAHNYLNIEIFNCKYVFLELLHTIKSCNIENDNSISYHFKEG